MHRQLTHHANSLESESIKSRLGSWIIVLSVVGYAPVGLAGTLLDLPRELTSVPFRAFVVLLALSLIFRLLNDGWRTGIGLLIVFWSMYLLRLLWDWNDGQQKMEEAVVFLLGTVVVPGVAVGLLGAEAIDWRRTALRSLWIGVLFCAAGAIGFQLGLGRESEAIQATGRFEYDTVNTITIGHTAVTTVIAALSLATVYRSTRRRTLLLLAVLPALIALALSAARGPAVALFACLAAFLIATRKRVALALLLVSGFILVTQTDNELSRRMYALLEPTLEDESSLERISLIRNALGQFVENPLSGSRLLDPEYLTYPHNLFLEAMMAMGIVGLLVLLAILLRSAVRAVRLLEAGELFIPLVLLQYFVAAQFSGAIWGWSAMWVPLAAVMTGGTRAARDSLRPA